MIDGCIEFLWFHAVLALPVSLVSDSTIDIFSKAILRNF